MKKVLITGVNSYVGNSLETWLQQYPEEYKVDKISVRHDDWKEKDFSQYDSIVHVAGIAHVSRDPKMEKLYYRVNRDLTIELANKAKKEKVKQFIFLSSIIVYGENIENGGIITKDTIPKPSNFYGNSKLQAEEGIKKLQDEQFNIVIVRPPMIYGSNSRGNYPKLVKLAKITPMFPDIENKRSMIYIDNLSEFLRLIIKNRENGLYFPQNKEYVETSKMVKMISTIYDKKIMLVKILNPFIKPFIIKQGIINKMFGNLYYEKEMSFYKENYCLFNLYETLKNTKEL